MRSAIRMDSVEPLTAGLPVNCAISTLGIHNSTGCCRCFFTSSPEYADVSSASYPRDFVAVNQGKNLAD